MEVQSAVDHPESPLRRLFARREDPYAGGDLVLARRLGWALWVIATLLTWLLLPLSPPDHAIGDAGWALAGATTVSGLLGARWMRVGHVTWNRLLVTSYGAAVQVCMLDWLAGGTATPYGELYFIIGLYAGALHPPRRVLGVLAAVAVASAAPIAYADLSGEGIALVALRFILVAAMALMASALMATVRAQRVALRDRGDDAEQLARIDDLTGLPNRRAFTEALDAALDSGRPLSLVIADLDDFKTINDTFGHQAGDACLRAVAGALRSSLREDDTCFRWGGDEFALLLDGTALEDAERICRRAAEAVAGQQAPDGSPLRITCAPAQLTAGMRAYELVDAADRVLLERKVSRTTSAA